MIYRSALVSVLAASVVGATFVHAQQPSAPAMPTVPQNTCVKPDFPGPYSDSRRLDRFNKEAKTYSDCIKKFVDDAKALSDAALDAGNKAIKDFNTFAQELAERQPSAK